MERLDKYFEKCIRDAYRSEEREYNPKRTVWFYVVVENQILFSITTPYERVTRKAVQRIKNNVEKNFGFRLDGDYFLDRILQPMLVCNHFKAGKSDYFLCKKMDIYKMEEGKVLPSGKMEKLIKAYYGITNEQLQADREETESVYHLPGNMAWETYRELHNRAFGSYPEVMIEHKSRTAI